MSAPGRVEAFSHIKGRAGHISENIGEVMTASEDANRAADQVLDSAQHLSAQSDNLRSEVAKFVQDVRAA
jgi:methyl-accepting chemotaxis protein